MSGATPRTPWPRGVEDEVVSEAEANTLARTTMSSGRCYALAVTTVTANTPWWPGLPSSVVRECWRQVLARATAVQPVVLWQERCYRVELRGRGARLLVEPHVEPHEVRWQCWQ